MTARILFVSNGVGEDLIASRIIACLTDRVAVWAYPLVGKGAYPASVPLLEPRRELPSGGFSLRAGLRGLRADLAAGIAGLWLGQRRTLAAQRGKFGLVVAVGDTYCLWMAGLASPRVAFVSTADSVRIGPFGPLARWVLRRCARRIFARDPDTTAALQAQRLPAVWLGNVMMDLVEPTGETLWPQPDLPVVALLPGSRREAAENTLLLAQAAAAIASRMPQVRFLVAVAPTVSEASLRNGLLRLPGVSVSGDGEIVLGEARLLLTRAFADAVMRARIAIGMAGTAHEQAAGLGRPVVAFPGPGAQFGPEFLATQRRLLGEAVVTARSWQDASEAAVRLLTDPGERVRRGEIGRARMGPAGGAGEIARALVDLGPGPARPPASSDACAGS
jgi:uncharacterized protein (TIGR03492 family)